MITEEKARKQLETLHQEGSALAEEFRTEQQRLLKLYGKPRPKKNGELTVIIRDFSAEEKKEKKKKKEQVPERPATDEIHFEERYQSWYSRTLPLMKQLAQDRYTEFQSFYLVDPRYPRSSNGVYVIQDYFRDRESDDSGEATVRCFKNQLAILKSVQERLAWTTLNTEDQAERGLQLSLLETARTLMEVNERAAGALAGTLLEAYLKKLAAKHQVKLRKQSPPLKELADALNAARVLDIPAHSQVTWLAHISDRCTSKGEGATKLQVRDLIDGTRWLLTNVF